MKYAALIVLLIAGCAHALPPDALRARLLEMYRADQAVQMDPRSNPPDTQHDARIEAVFTRQGRELRQLVAAQGWPRRSVVGDEAAHAAWVMVDHADDDVAFQERVLAIITTPAYAGEVENKAIALLTDRTLKNRHRPQRYGSQLENGELYPIEDPAHVDERRAQMGLVPLAEYVAQTHQLERQLQKAYEQQQQQQQQ